MDNTDFEIELQEEQNEEEAAVQLPLNFLSFGVIENDDIKVYIKQDVYKKLEKLASSDTSKELGSILLGDYCEELGKTHVIISEYIEAKYTDASASTLTFTHETWDYVYKEQEETCPDKKIIGWQHTHPNYGIFLSNYDMFIQENFFNLPFQIAYVIDPIQNIRGFFQWKNGKVEKLNGYYIYDEIGKPIKIEQKKVEKNDTNEIKKSSKSMYGIVGILSAALVGLAIFAFSINGKYNDQLKAQEEIVSVMNDQSNTIKNLQDKLSETVPSEDGSITISNDGIEFKAYTVVKGDSLFSICEENNIDYSANINVILGVNGIDNPSHIDVGQTILLPILE